MFLKEVSYFLGFICLIKKYSNIVKLTAFRLYEIVFLFLF